MKKIVLLILLFASAVSFGQTKKTTVTYSEGFTNTQILSITGGVPSTIYKSTTGDFYQIDINGLPQPYSASSGSANTSTSDLINNGEGSSPFITISDIPTSQIFPSFVKCASGKNLIDTGLAFQVPSGYYNTSSVFVPSASWRVLQKIEVDPNTEYVLSGSNIHTLVYYITESDANDNIVNSIARDVSTAGRIPFVTGVNTKYILLSVINSSWAAGKATLMMEKGTAPTAYEPYDFIYQLPSEVVKYEDTEGVRSSFPSFTYYNAHEKFPRLRKAVLEKNEDVILVIAGTSLSQGTPYATSRTDAATRPPLLGTNDFASSVYDKLIEYFPNQQNRRYDHSYFTYSGTFAAEKDNADWDTRLSNIGLEGWTNISQSANASVSFTVPTDALRFNFIYRTDSKGDACTVSVAEGNGKMVAYNGTAWVEANGYTFSMLESAATATKGNTVFQKRLDMKSVSPGTKAITISKSSDVTKRLNVVGVEWSKREHILEVINSSKGTHRWSDGIYGLNTYQGSMIHAHNPTLILCEITTINYGAGNKINLNKSKEYFTDFTKRYVFNGFNDYYNSLLDQTAAGTEFIFYNNTLPATTAFDVVGNDGVLSTGTPTSGSQIGDVISCVDHYNAMDSYMWENHSQYTYISTHRVFQEVSEKHFGSYYVGLLASGISGRTLTSDGIHWNDNGAALVSKLIIPLFDF